MKKIKIFFAVLLSAICLSLTFSGCSPTSNYKVKFDYEYNDHVVNYTLKITLPNAPKKNEGAFVWYEGNYRITYTLNVYDDGLIIAKNKLTENFNLYYSNTVEFEEIKYRIDKDLEAKHVTATITNVSVEKADKKHRTNSYAIGFGVTAGFLLIGAVVVFVLDKKGILIKRK